jgi:hypothetical protein
MRTTKQNPLGATKGSFETRISLNYNAYLPYSQPFLGAL